MFSLPFLAHFKYFLLFADVFMFSMFSFENKPNIKNGDYCYLIPFEKAIHKATSTSG